MVFWNKSASPRNQVLYLPVGSIRKNPQQPRTYFDPEALGELANSISLYGILQPLTVRETEAGWELVAGERRLRAAKLAGLTEVPCLTVQATGEESGLLALMENLQRRDLRFREEAEGLRKLMVSYGMSQSEAARRLGKSQSAVANKLRLLQHPPVVLDALEEADLTERHARALLRLEETEEKLKLIARMKKEDWSVARLEKHLEERKSKKSRSLWKTGMLRDLRMFFSSMENALSTVRLAGFLAQSDKEETENEIVLTIRLSKQAHA